MAVFGATGGLLRTARVVKVMSDNNVWLRKAISR